MRPPVFKWAGLASQTKMAHSQPWEQLIESLPLPEKPESLTIQHKLDKGAWGMVYAGVFDGRPVAVKAIHDTLVEGVEGGHITVRNFCKECDRLKALEHNHVIKFLGAFKDAKLGPILVMEKMEENLRQFLKRCRGKLTVSEQLCISLNIARGVAFLHQLDPPMVHRDLNDKNVMFSSEGVAKIGDFGQSKLKQDLYLTTTQPGMVAFMPPEALRAKNCKYDESLDMFSLGVLMLEIGTQHRPNEGLEGIAITPEVKRREADLGRMSHLHPLKPSILCCLRDDPKLRLKASELLVVLPVLFVNAEEVQQTLVEHNNCKSQQQLEEVQQELEEVRDQLKTVQEENAGVQQELEGVQQELEDANSERDRCLEAHHASQKELEAALQEREATNSKVQQLTDCLSQKEELIEAFHAKEKEFESTTQRLESELIEAKSKGQQLSNELCTVTEHIQSPQAEQEQMKVDCTRRTKHVESELAATRQRLKAKDAELHGAQQQLTQLQAELNELTAARKPTPEANDQIVHTSTQLSQRQWKIDEMYLHVQERSIMQQKNIDSIVHHLEEHIQDSVESAEFAEGSQMYVASEQYSEGYMNWELGYEIILCSVLQLCYDMCGVVLAHKVAREAVRAYKDGRSFDPDVVAMLQNSLTEKDHAVLEDVASCLVANGFSIQAQTQQTNSRKYMAVYSLITAYLDITPAQDYIASAKQDILADEVLKVATVHSCVEAFVDKVLPLCWKLVTMYVPPIMTCYKKEKVDGALHDLSRMSSRADTVQSYLFPVVWYGGDVHRKARVLAENFK